MRKIARRSLAMGAAAAAVTLAAPAVHAAEWPNKPVRIIYNYPPGTGGDVVTRQICDALSQQFGQTFIVDNRAGASGTVGVEAASRMTPTATPSCPARTRRWSCCRSCARWATTRATSARSPRSGNTSMDGRCCPAWA